jgi:hypothetical protein
MRGAEGEGLGFVAIMFVSWSDRRAVKCARISMSFLSVDKMLVRTGNTFDAQQKVAFRTALKATVGREHPAGFM